NKTYRLSRIFNRTNRFNEILDHHSLRGKCARRTVIDPGTRASKAVTRRTYRRWCEMRFSRTERDPRRTGAALQYVSRSLAIRSDSDGALLTATAVRLCSCSDGPVGRPSPYLTRP